MTSLDISFSARAIHSSYNKQTVMSVDRAAHYKPSRILFVGARTACSCHYYHVYNYGRLS